MFIKGFFNALSPAFVQVFNKRTIRPQNEKFTEYISVDFLNTLSAEPVFCE